MFTRVLLALALSLPAFSAFGADMALKARPSVVPPSSCHWCGFALGVHVGYGWARSGFGGTVLDEFELGNLEPEGVFFGGQAGHLWQWGGFVAGLEAQGSYWGLKKSADLKVGEVAVISNTIELKYTAALHAVLGMEVMNNVLVYLAGGPAFANAEGTLKVGDAVVTAPANHFGYEFGGGIRSKLFSDAFIVGVEAMWSDYGKATYSFQGLDAPGRAQATTVKARFDIKLN